MTTCWATPNLGKLFNFKNGVNADKAAYGSGTPFVNVLEVITHSHLHLCDVAGKVLIGATAKEAYAVQCGDVLFNRTSETQEEVGLAAIYVDQVSIVFGGFVIRARPTTDCLFPIIARGQGAIRANIGQSDLKLVDVPVPPLPEQRAIVEALADADALVEALDAALAKKRDLKQAAMQQLLTGQTRLPGFSASWELSCVGREFDIQLGKMLDAERNRGIEKPYLGNRAVQWNRIDLDDLPVVRMSRTDVERYRLRKGDLLVCEGGEVGRAAIWEAPIEECYYQKALHRLRPIRGFAPRLLALFLRHWTTQGLLADYVTQTSIAHLTREKLAEVPLPIPSPREQAAIVAVFSDMDAEIAALEARRDKTRLLKQAMMQELLTGRTRLV